MRLSSVSALAVFALFTGCSVASADEATTYAGTLGKASIIVELQAPGKDGAFFGRYSYMIKGVDIPLHGMDAKGVFTIGEEKPCTDALCRMANDELVDKAPIGAEWSLKSNSKGDDLEGTWTDKDSGKTLPIKLTKKGIRPLSAENTGVDMLDADYSPATGQTSTVLTPKDLPYDFLKLQHPFKKGKVVAIGSSSYRMDTDIRTALDYPTVIKLGKADPAALNRGLMDQRLRWEETAFGCLKRAYLGYGWAGLGGEGTNGFDDEPPTVTVDYLTPRLMGITESGSQFCGFAHPNNFEDHSLIDAKTGRLVTTRDLLADWVARDIDGNIADPAKVADPDTLIWGPGDKLLDYLDKHRDDGDDSADEDCRTQDNMRGNVGIYLKDDQLIFALVDMPYANTECAAVLTRVPIKAARPFLTEAGARYFAELDK
jgi:hypothetical protein